MLIWILNLIFRKDKLLAGPESWERGIFKQMIPFVPNQSTYKLDRSVDRNTKAYAFLGNSLKLFCKFKKDKLILDKIELEALEEGDIITVVFYEKRW